MRTAIRTWHAPASFQPTGLLRAPLFAALLIISLALPPAAQAQTPLMQVEDASGDVRFEVTDQFSFFPSLLGIGTSSPVTPLHVAGSQGSFRAHPIFSPDNGTVLLGTWEGDNGNAPQIRYLGAGSGFFDLGMDADGNLTIERNDIPRLTLLTGGNTGIGTTTPSSRLSVAGVIESTTGGIKFPDGSIQTTAGGSGDDGDWTIDGNFLTTFNRGLIVSGDIGQVRASIGRGATASGDNTFATGLNTTASGAYSVALNRATNATGISSIAMGQGAEASGDISFAAGVSTSAEGTASTALGQTTTASGGVSTALGNGTTSSGFASVAMGTSTIADRSNMLAVGRYNAPDFDPGNVLFAVGNGTGINARSNTLTVDGDGDVFALGQILANTDLIAGGEIGVNVSSPVTRLHVAGNKFGGASPGNHIAVIENAAGNDGDVLYLKTGASGSNLSGGENFITFADGAGNGVGAVEGENGNVEFKSTGADFAELLPRLNVSEVIEAGRIVGITNGWESLTAR